MLEEVASGKLLCNVIDVSCKRCLIAPSLGPAIWVKAQIVWSAMAYCWDGSVSARPPLKLHSDAKRMKREQEQWQASILIDGIQSLRGSEPSVCSVSWALMTPVTVSEARTGMIEVAGGLLGAELPSDVRIYGNYGEDVYADGGMNIVFQSRTHDVDRLGWKERFLRPKPLLGARVSEIEALRKDLGIRGEQLLAGSVTASGEQIGFVFLEPEHIDHLAESKGNASFVQRTAL